MEEALVGPVANDHEAQISKMTSKWFQPKCCPSGLNKTELPKLRHARWKKLKMQGMEKNVEDVFNKTHLIFPQTAKHSGETKMTDLVPHQKFQQELLT